MDSDLNYFLLPAEGTDLIFESLDNSNTVLFQCLVKVLILSSWEKGSECSLGSSQAVLRVKNQPASTGDIKDVGSFPGSGRSPGGGHGNPLHVIAWRIQWTEEPGGLQFIGSQTVGHN